MLLRMSIEHVSEADELGESEQSVTYIHRDPDKRNMKKTILVYGLPGPQVPHLITSTKVD